MTRGMLTHTTDFRIINCLIVVITHSPSGIAEQREFMDSLYVNPWIDGAAGACVYMYGGYTEFDDVNEIRYYHWPLCHDDIDY